MMVFHFPGISVILIVVFILAHSMAPETNRISASLDIVMKFGNAFRTPVNMRSIDCVTW